MHLNMNHPPNKDMIRLLVLMGGKQASIAAANALRCSACARNVSTRYPRPSKMPRVGQFGDRLEMDICYVVGADGQAFPFLGVIDKATLYHLVRAISSRRPEDVFAVLKDMWLVPLGLPVSIVCDADGAFQGACARSLSFLGVHLEVIPAEAHEQIGTIERHNYTWRNMVQRMIDAVAAVLLWQIDLCGTCLLYTSPSPRD